VELVTDKLGVEGMFEGRALSELTYAEVEGFLKEANEEGTRLDYKQQWDPAKAARVVSSFANIAGGPLVMGVDEKRDPKSPKIKLRIPDPANVPRLIPQDWEASASDAVRSRTRPGLVPEARALEIPNHPDRHVVLLVRVDESLEAPHEVHASSTPEILVRRGDNTESAGLVESARPPPRHITRPLISKIVHMDFREDPFPRTRANKCTLYAQTALVRSLPR
jgi:hypothetical protein